MLPTRPHLTDLVVPAATIAAAISAFAVLVDSVTEREGLARLDPTVTTDVVSHRTGILTATAHVLTFIGSEVFVAFAALGLVIVLLERRGARPALITAATMAVSAALTVGVKMVVGRARPGASDRVGAFDSSYSFPSGHTLNSAVFLGLVCLFAVPLLRRARVRLLAYALAVVLGAGIGASRIYLGYHWTTDVLASWTIAATVLAVAHVTSRALIPPAEQSGGVQVDRATVDS